MVESINHIAHVMGRQTIVEFVEDEAVLACFRAMGVDFVQGYGVGRPQPLQAAQVSTSSESRRGLATQITWVAPLSSPDDCSLQLHSLYSS